MKTYDCMKYIWIHLQEQKFPLLQSFSFDSCHCSTLQYSCVGSGQAILQLMMANYLWTFLQIRKTNDKDPKSRTQLRCHDAIIMKKNSNIQIFWFNILQIIFSLCNEKITLREFFNVKLKELLNFFLYYSFCTLKIFL